MSVDDALRMCARITREHSSTFYLGSSLFGGRRRQAVRALYAVCRVGDDAVDDAPDADAAERRLDAWWAGIERAYAGTPGDDPVELALTWVLEQFRVPLAAFAELRLGLCSDIAARQPGTVDELLLYCRRVAGVVGQLVVPVAGHRGGAELEARVLADAVALGRAMQLTNIVRDVGEDLAMGRCYLPLELLAQYELEMADLRAMAAGGPLLEGYVALLEHLAAMAMADYRQGWRSIPLLRGRAAPAVALAALNYEGILAKVRQNGYDNLNQRAYLRPHERLALLPQALKRGVSGGPWEPRRSAQRRGRENSV